MELILNTFGTSLNRDNEAFVITTHDGQRQRLPVRCTITKEPLVREKYKSEQ